MGKFCQGIFFVLCVLGLASCRVDELSPCDDDLGLPGLLCKEYRFEDSTAVGYLSYYYDKAGALTRIDYNSIDGNAKKHETYTYENKMLVREVEAYPDGKVIRETRFAYEDNGRLLESVATENGISTTRTFEYDGGVLRRENEFRQGELLAYITYQYFANENKLFKKLYYSGNNTLLKYTVMEYYQNNIIRYKYYEQSGEFLGYDAEHYNGFGNVVSYTTYNDENTELGTTIYDFNELNQLEKTTVYGEGDKVLSYRIFKYYLQ